MIRTKLAEDFIPLTVEEKLEDLIADVESISPPIGQSEYITFYEKRATIMGKLKILREQLCH